MTPEQQRIAIVEACQSIFRWNEFTGRIKWIDTDNETDPLNDLNAIHEAARTRLQSWTERTDYAQWLRVITVREATADMRNPDAGVVPDFYFYDATAAQRAEAFLRAIGKWIEELKP